MDRVCIIGAGAVGSTIGHALHRSGLKISMVADRSLLSAQKAAAFIGEGTPTDEVIRAPRGADVVFITTSDSAISDVCKRIADGAGFAPETFVFHCSGSLTSAALDAAHERGAHVGSLHPLQTFANVEQAVKHLAGTYFTFEGDAQAEAKAEEIVARIGGVMFSIQREDKALYHAGAVCASNYIVTMTHLATELLEASGIPKKEALKALMPLLKGALNNIASLGLPDALTGPIARGDTSTLQEHLDAMKAKAAHVEKAYREIARHTVKVALEKGALKPADAEKIEALLGPS